MFCQRLPAEVPLGLPTSLPSRMWGKVDVGFPSTAECLEGRRPALSFWSIVSVELSNLTSFSSASFFSIFVGSKSVRMSRFEPPELGTHLQGKVVVLTGTCIHAATCNWGWILELHCKRERTSKTPLPTFLSLQTNQYTNTPNPFTQEEP